MAKKKTEVKIVQDEQAPVPVEVLAESIKSIADGVRRLRAGPLRDDTLCLLIAKACKPVGNGYNKKRPTERQVRAVLNGIEALEAQYLK